MFGRTLGILAANLARNEVASGENVLRVQVLLDGIDHSDSGLSYCLVHPPPSDLSHTVVMGQRTTASDYLVARRCLDVVVDLHRVRQTVVVDGEVEVNARACVVDLSHSLLLIYIRFTSVFNCSLKISHIYC